MVNYFVTLYIFINWHVYTFVPHILLSVVDSVVLTSSHYLMLWSVPSCHMIILVSYVPCKVECYILRPIGVLGVWYMIGVNAVLALSQV